MNIRFICLLLATISLRAFCIGGDQSASAVPVPSNIKAALTSGTTVTLNSIFTVDGRDHDTSGALLTGTGTFGVWCSQAVTLTGGARIGGTNISGNDFAPGRPPDTSIIRANVGSPGIPTPDALFGLPEGTLRILARTGAFPGQCVTAAAQLSYPLSGLTYIDLPANATVSGSISGSGILIIHNYDADASSLQNWTGTFKGLVFADQVSSSSANGTILGGVAAAGLFSVSGTGSIIFSRAAIANAVNSVYPFASTCMKASPETIKLPDAEFGIPYHFAFTAAGGTPPLSWSAVRIPSWLSLSVDGILMGTPSGISADTLLLTATDATGCTIGRCYVLTVDAATAMSGRVVWDANHNFTADAGESGLADWDLDLHGVKDDSTVTDAEGHYNFAGEPMGNYLLQVRNRSGWVEEAFSPKYFSPSDSMLLSYMVAVFKHLDTIGHDASQYFQLPTVAGGGGGSFAGYTIPSNYAADIFASYSVSTVFMSSLIINADCRFPGAGRISATCDGSGFFSLISGMDARLHPIALKPSQPVFSENDLTLYPFEIRGRVFSNYQDLRTGLSGRTVHLHGSIDATAVTDQDGNYVFRNFPWGIYTVTEDSVPEWQISYPSERVTGVENSSARAMAIQLHLLDIITDADRYYWTLSSFGGGGGTFSGYSIPPSLTTDSLATYQLTGIPAGTLAVTAKPNWSSESVQFTIDGSGGWSTLYISSPDYDFYPRSMPASHLLSLQPISASLELGYVNANFGNTQEKEIRGSVYADSNANGVRDPGENGIEGWRVFLSGSRTDSTTTDVSGSYEFSNLPAGTYVVSEGYSSGTWASTPSFTPITARRDTIIRNLADLCRQSDQIAVDASRYWDVSIRLGGGGGSFFGYTAPTPLAAQPGGICFPVSWGWKSVSLRDSSLPGFGNMYSAVDTAAMLQGVSFTGELNGLNSRIVHTDSSAAVFSNVDFGNVTLIESMTASSVGNGSIFPSGAVTVMRGSDQEFSFTPQMGYRLDSVVVDGANQGSVPSYTFQSVDAHHAIIAYFSLEQYLFNISLNERWNLVSVPMIANDERKSALFPGAASEAFSFQGSYHLTDTLFAGKGYWIKFDQPETMRTTGGRIWNDTIAVLEGWNLIGSISYPLAAKDLGCEPAELIISQLFGYEGRYVPCDTIEPWDGYWMKVNQNGLLILSRQEIEFSKPGVRNRVHIVPTSDLPPAPPDGRQVSKRDLPKEFSLDQTYPNPFNPTATIRYALPVPCIVSLKICNLLGEAVATLVDGNQGPGYQTANWNAGTLASGIYFCRLDAVSVNDPARRYTELRKMVLLK